MKGIMGFIILTAKEAGLSGAAASLVDVENLIQKRGALYE